MSKGGNEAIPNFIMVRVKLFMAKSSQICDDAFDIKMTFSCLITGRVLILNWAL